jgi:hypothetical protein
MTNDQMPNCNGKAVPYISLSEFTGTDDLERFSSALAYMKDHPGTTLIVPPKTYHITTELARREQQKVMNGEYGNNPEPAMFNPKYIYSRGLDFDGHKNSTVIADGAVLLIDGFMEPISIRSCSGVTIKGFTIDHKRKPYSKGLITDIAPHPENENMQKVSVEFPYDITPYMPVPRSCVYLKDANRFDLNVRVKKMWYADSRHAVFDMMGFKDSMTGCELYLWHTFHSRPAILIEDAVNTTLQDITIHSHCGMGITAFHADNILIERLRVIPSAGEHMSTNTDATHFASCRGKLRLDGCEFEGQGDDSINVHTYYYTIKKTGSRTCRLSIQAPTGTHTQSLDYPLEGDRLELTHKSSLAKADTYKVVTCVPDKENRIVEITVDKNLPDNADNDYFLADIDELPQLEFVNCHARNHFARGVLIKCRKALIENCTFTDIAESAVKISAEASWHEGVNSEDVTIRRCRIINCGRRSLECGGITVSMDAEIPDGNCHGKITIEDNIIDCPHANHSITLANAAEVILRRNQLSSGETCGQVICPDIAVTDGFPVKL